MKKRALSLTLVFALVLPCLMLLGCGENKQQQEKLEIVGVKQNVWGTVSLELKPYTIPDYAVYVEVSRDGNNWQSISNAGETVLDINTLEQMDMLDGGEVTFYARLGESDGYYAGEKSEPFTATLKGSRVQDHYDLVNMTDHNEDGSYIEDSPRDPGYALIDYDGTFKLMKKNCTKNASGAGYTISFSELDADTEFEYIWITYDQVSYIEESTGMSQRNTALELEADAYPASRWTAYDKSTGFTSSMYTPHLDEIKTTDEDGNWLYTDWYMSVLLRVKESNTRLACPSAVYTVGVRSEYPAPPSLD